MASKAAAGDTPRFKRTRERLVDFEPAAVAAPFSLRCGALLADYVLIIVVPVVFLLISRAAGNDGATLINSGLNDIGWLTGTLIAVVNGILLPIATGRTFGKFVTGLRIVRTDGTDAPTGKVILRQVLAVILFIFTAGLSFFFSALTATGRSLHDYIAGTVVIYAEKRVRG